MRCFGHDVYNISGYVDESGAMRLRQRVTRRELSEDDNKFTNAFFYLKLCNTYGADLPLLLKWTFTLLPPVTAEYWKTWNMTSTEPLDREKADNLNRTIKKVFDLMVSLRIEMLKDDFVKTLQSSMESKKTIEPVVVTSHNLCCPNLKIERASEASIAAAPIQEDVVVKDAEVHFSRSITHDVKSDFLCDLDQVIEVTPEENLVSLSLSRNSFDHRQIKESVLTTTQAANFSTATTCDMDEVEIATLEQPEAIFLSESLEESSSLPNSSKKLGSECVDDNEVEVVHRSSSYELAVKKGRDSSFLKEDFEDIHAEIATEQLEPVPLALSKRSTGTVKSLETISRSPTRGLHKRFQSIVRRIIHLSRRVNMNSYDYPNVVRSSIQVGATSGEKMICVGDGYIKFNPEIIIRDVMLVTRCCKKDAEIIADAVKERVTDTTTLHDVWEFVKQEIQSSSIEIKIKQDPRFKILTGCEAETVSKVPISIVSDLFKNKAFKKIA